MVTNVMLVGRLYSSVLPISDTVDGRSVDIPLAQTSPRAEVVGVIVVGPLASSRRVWPANNIIVFNLLFSFAFCRVLIQTI